MLIRQLRVWTTLQSEEHAEFISDLESQFICFVIDSDKADFTDEFHKLQMEK